MNHIVELQVRFVDAFRALYLEESQAGRGTAVYRLGFRALGALCAEPAAFAAWRAESKLVYRFLNAIGLPAHRYATLVSESVRANLWRQVWGDAFNRLEGEDFDRLVQVRGADLLSECRKDGRGTVFVHRHSVFARVYWTWLKRQGIDPGLAIGHSDWKLAETQIQDVRTSTLDGARELMRAFERLLAGGHVHILPDAFIGRRAFAIAFLGRQRGFQPTFAQLAQQTGAAVIPVETRLVRDGRIRVEIGPPFDTDAAISQEGGVVHGLVHLYARHLQRRWLECPSEIVLPHMEKYLGLPSAPAPGASLVQVVPQSRRLAVCCGVYSSGSTWTFNLMREICERESGDSLAANPRNFLALYADKDAGLPADVTEARMVLLKTHKPSASLRLMIATNPSGLVLTVRDPRDAVVSAMQRFHITFGQALDRVVASTQAVIVLAKATGVAPLRYEDGFIGTAETFDRIASLLGARVEERDRNAMLSQLSAEQVAERISTLAVDGRFPDGRTWDTRTQWHVGHVGDGRVGKYAEHLSQGQARAVLSRTEEFCRLFGYEVFVAHSGAEDPDDSGPSDTTSRPDTLHWADVELRKENLRADGRYQDLSLDIIDLEWGDRLWPSFKFKIRVIGENADLAFRCRSQFERWPEHAHRDSFGELIVIAAADPRKKHRKAWDSLSDNDKIVLRLIVENLPRLIAAVVVRLLPQQAEQWIRIAEQLKSRSPGGIGSPQAPDGTIDLPEIDSAAKT